MNLAVMKESTHRNLISPPTPVNKNMAQASPLKTFFKIVFYLIILLLHFLGGAAKLYLKTAKKPPWVDEMDQYLDAILLFLMGFDLFVFAIIPLTLQLRRELQDAYTIINDDDESVSAGEVDRYFSAISMLDPKV